MFSKQMENLIQATLEDGKLEENEKAALIKRAQKEGIDLDELEIYINSLLQKRKRELNKENEAREEKHQQVKKEAFGRVCPNCGKQVPPLTLKCDCGYEFTKGKSVSSVQLLSDKIEAILSKPYRESDPNSDEYKEEVRQRYQRVKETIKLFPVPNTKEDIIEFLSLSAPNAKKKGGIWGTKSGRILVVGIICLLFAVAMGFITGGKHEAGSFAAGFLIFGLLPASFVFCIYSVGLSNLNPTFIHNDLATTWRAKFDQVMIKARSLRGDSEFTQQLDYYENMVK